MRYPFVVVPAFAIAAMIGCEQSSSPSTPSPSSSGTGAAQTDAASALDRAADAAGNAMDQAAGAVGGAIDAAKDAVADFGFPEGAVTFATGSFAGQNDHTVSGHIALARAGDTVYLGFAPDFSHDEAPDPKVGFGNNGSYDKATTFHELKSRSGVQLYEVPSTIDVSKYSEVYVWCEEFSVALAKAPLTK
jgi:hypothetical protein